MSRGAPPSYRTFSSSGMRKEEQPRSAHGQVYQDASARPVKTGDARISSGQNSAQEAAMTRYLQGNEELGREFEELAKMSQKGSQDLLQYQKQQISAMDNLRMAQAQSINSQLQAITESVGKTSLAIVEAAKQTTETTTRSSGGSVIVRYTDLPTFDGVEGLDFVEFQREFDRVMRMGQWSSTEALGYLEHSLRDAALVVYNTGAEEYRNGYPSLEVAWKVLKTHYLSMHQRNIWIQKLHNLVMEPKETVAKYYARYLKALELAYGDSEPSVRELTGVVCFTAGLRPRDLKRIVERQNFTKVSDAKQFAEAEEDRNNRDEEERGTVTSVMAMTSQVNAPPQQKAPALRKPIWAEKAKEAQQQVQRMQQSQPSARGFFRGNGRSRGRGMGRGGGRGDAYPRNRSPYSTEVFEREMASVRPGQCWLCKGWGHRGDDCPSHLGDTGSVCPNCEGFGHLQPQCPSVPGVLLTPVNSPRPPPAVPAHPIANPPVPAVNPVPSVVVHPPQPPPTSPTVCYRCKQFGHILSDCPSLIAEVEALFPSAPVDAAGASQPTGSPAGQGN